MTWMNTSVQPGIFLMNFIACTTLEAEQPFPSLGLQDKALTSKIKRLDLSPDGEFLTLFVVPLKNGSEDEIMNDLVLVKLARVVLMIWLGAVEEGREPAIKDLIPWELENIEYHGLAGDNPLATNFKGRDGTKKRGDQKGKE
jgi:hypothetical protein